MTTDKSSPTQTADAVEALECLDDLIGELRGHADDLPACVQKDYMHLAADRLTKLEAALSHTATSEGVDEIISFIRQQAKIGAEWAKSSERGTKRRVAYGGGSLALKRIAEEIERGAYSNAECVGCGHYIGHLDYDVDDNGETGCEACFTQDGSGKCFTLTAPNTPENTATSEATPTHDSGLAGELLGAQKAIDPTAPTKDIALQQAIAWFDDYTVLHTSKQTPDGERKAQTNKERADYLRTALQSNSDSELLREARDLLRDAVDQLETDRETFARLASLPHEMEEMGAAQENCTNVVTRIEAALARLEQGATP